MDESQAKDVLLDKLLERWLFEKRGAALYETVIDKLASAGFRDVQALRDIREEELEHQRALEKLIHEYGGQLGMRTPSQLLVEQESRALEAIATEAATEEHLLRALLSAELEDHEGWDLLITLAANSQFKHLLGKLEFCFEQEKEHLRLVRGLVESRTRHALEELAP